MKLSGLPSITLNSERQSFCDDYWVLPNGFKQTIRVGDLVHIKTLDVKNNRYLINKQAAVFQVTEIRSSKKFNFAMAVGKLISGNPFSPARLNEEHGPKITIRLHDLSESFLKDASSKSLRGINVSWLYRIDSPLLTGLFG